MMIFNRALLGSVTVWYNPKPVFVQNIHSYAPFSNLVVVVDNSVVSNRHLFDQITAINKVYLWSGGNRGIAHALNRGLDVLIAKGFQFALTLDQDSSFEKSEIEKLLSAAEKISWDNTGLLSPLHVQQKSVPVYNPDEFTPVTCVMASGNVLNLETAARVGFFNEQLFIDHVDNEYCLRLNKAGYKVLLTNAFLIHELGRYRDVTFFGRRVGGFISHPPERLYYFVRNSVYILKRYFFLDPKYTRMELTSLAKRFFKLFFEDNTRKRLGLYFKGIRDSRKLK